MSAAFDQQTSVVVTGAAGLVGGLVTDGLRDRYAVRGTDLRPAPGVISGDLRDAAFVDREGNPFVEIVTLADDLRVDAVIIGASSKAGHRFVGSLAVHLVKAARWPVMVGLD